MDQKTILSVLLENERVLNQSCQLLPYQSYTIVKDSVSYELHGCLMYLYDSNSIYLLDTPYRSKQHCEDVHGLLYAEKELIKEQQKESGEWDKYEIVRGFGAYAIATTGFYKGFSMNNEIGFKIYHQLHHADSKNRRKILSPLSILFVEANLYLEYEERLKLWMKCIRPYDTVVSDIVKDYFIYLFSTALPDLFASENWQEYSVMYAQWNKHPGKYHYWFLKSIYEDPSSNAPIRFAGIVDWMLKAIAKEQIEERYIKNPIIELTSIDIAPFTIEDGFSWWYMVMSIENGLQNEIEAYLKYREDIWYNETNKGLDTSIRSLDELHRLMYETEIANYQRLVSLRDIVDPDELRSFLHFISRFISYMELHFPLTHRNIYKYHPHHTLWSIEISVAMNEKYGYPLELDNQVFHDVLQVLIEHNYVDIKYSFEYYWNQSATLYYCFVKYITEKMHLSYSNGRTPWKLFCKIFRNAHSLYGAALKGAVKTETIRGREKLYVLLDTFFSENN